MTGVNIRAERKRIADEKGAYRKEFDEAGNESGVEKDVTNTLKQMYIGNRNKPQQRKADIVIDKGDVEDIPVLAVDLETPNESYNSDEVDLQFSVNESEMTSENIDRLTEYYHETANPSGTQPTAPRPNKEDNIVEAKKQKVKNNAKIAQARIQNAKLLAMLAFKKALIDRNDIPHYARLIANCDNNAFAILKDMVNGFKGAPQGRQAQASANNQSGMQTILHTAKPTLKGESLMQTMERAPWSGVPESNFNLADHMSK